ncbi:MAG: branched-chain amino acid aminotransferase [Isosphaera sp.]|nr:branched-chain amino acid aminotransferase [Isosphaera sp.]
MSLLWMNGRLVDKAGAAVSPFDHGFLYGDGVWEPLRVFGGKLFRPADHLDRLAAAAAVLGIDIPLSRDELLAAVEATVKANDRTDAYVRVIVSRGPGTIGPDPRKIEPQVIVIAEEYQPFPAELYGHGLHAGTSGVRVDIANPAARARTLGRPHLVLAKQHALRKGCLEAVLLTNTDILAGGTEGHVFVVKDCAVVDHPGFPPDAAAGVVREIAQELGLAFRITGTRLDGVRAADEVFLAGTACGVIGIVRLDGRDIGPGTQGPVTRQIRDRWLALARGGS